MDYQEHRRRDTAQPQPTSDGVENKMQVLSSPRLLPQKLTLAASPLSVYLHSLVAAQNTQQNQLLVGSRMGVAVWHLRVQLDVDWLRVLGL